MRRSDEGILIVLMHTGNMNIQDPKVCVNTAVCGKLLHADLQKCTCDGKKCCPRISRHSDSDGSHSRGTVESDRRVCVCVCALSAAGQAEPGRSGFARAANSGAKFKLRSPSRCDVITCRNAQVQTLGSRQSSPLRHFLCVTASE